MRVPRMEWMESSNRSLSIDGNGRAVPHEGEGNTPCRTCSFLHRALEEGAIAAPATHHVLSEISPLPRTRAHP